MCEKRGYMLSETKNVVFQLKAPYNIPKITVINSYTLQEIFSCARFHTPVVANTTETKSQENIIEIYRINRTNL